jgi:ADP-heptose:LPS heptosyltransferase
MRRVFVAPISFGLGDLVVSLPVIQALVAEGARTGTQTWVVARSAAQAHLAERIRGVTGCVDEESFDVTHCGGRFVDLRDHPLQRDFWWGSAEFEAAFGDLDINDILGRICADFGIDADFSRAVPLEAQPRPELSHSVLLVTETDGPGKLWPAGKWASLAAHLGTLGLEVRQVTRFGGTDEMRDTGIPELCAPTPGDAVDVLTACRAVIGIDTGLAHIAAQQGTPTVTICRQRSVFFRPWPNCRTLRGAACAEECLAAEHAYAYNARVSLRGFRWEPRLCPVGGRCLDSTGAEQALELLNELL